MPSVATLRHCWISWKFRAPSVSVSWRWPSAMTRTRPPTRRADRTPGRYRAGEGCAGRRELTGRFTSPSTTLLCSFRRGGRRCYLASPPLLIFMLQAAEERGQFLGPVAQALLDLNEDVAIAPLLSASSPGRNLRNLLAVIGPFLVQFLKLLDGFRQGAAAVDQLVYHALPGLDPA